MRRIVILLILQIIATDFCFGQLPHTFTQYTSEDGLSQNTIMSILQDDKGVMWFATWDGLYKFDGYTFNNYKAHPGDSIGLSNNRLDNIKEDRYGYIWVQSYNHQVYRFNPRLERFQAIPYDNYLSLDMYVLPCGDVWIITVQNELIHISTHPETHEMKATDFFKSHQISYSEPIKSIFQDSRENQWILTENGLYRLTRNGHEEKLSSYFVAPPEKDKQPFYDALENNHTIYFTSKQGCVYEYNPDTGQFVRQEFPTGSSIKTIRQLKKDKLFIGTASDGFFVYEQSSGNHRHYNTRNYPSLKDNQIKAVYIDTNGEAWIRLNTKGVTHFNPENEQFDHFILQDKYGKDIVDSRPEMYIYEDVNGSLWVHPSGGGLAWYDRKNNRIRPFYNPALQSGWSADNKVTNVFTDKQGNLWLGSYGNGLEKISFNTNHFHLLTAAPDDTEFPGSNVRAVYQDRNGYIWTGNKDKVIRVYDSQWRYVGNLTSSGTISPYSTDKLGIGYSIIQDHEGTIWIGTKGNGLFAARPQGKPLTYHLVQYSADANDVYCLSGNEIYSLHEDRQQRIWIATFEGGINYLERGTDKEADRFINYRNRLKNYPISQCYRTRFITSDTKGNIWIGSATGLLMCKGNFKEPEEIEFQRYCRISGNANSLSNNDVHNIYFTRKGEMYVATFGGGLNKLLSLEGAEARFQAYTMKNGLPSDVLLSIEEDPHGNLWCATEKELCKFIPSTDKIINYPSRAFPLRISFNEGAALRTASDYLMFNTVKGVLYFFPDSIHTSTYVPPIIFTRLQQAEKTVTPEEGGILTTHIDDTNLLTLPHDKNGFSIQFAALDMKYPGNISYSYKLEGFENNWNNIGNQRTATYTNLPKGHYTLKVRSTNSDGIWVENTRTLDINILPSFWETPWAYSLYVLFILLVIFTATYILFTIFRLKHKVSVEQEISDIKLRFFTNISHELRTPLTLIAGPVEQVLQHGKLNDEEREQLVLVERNTNRMLRLVNQILDFRKIQNKKMKMQVQRVDIVPFVRKVMENFEAVAEEHRIDFLFQTEKEHLYLWVDADKLEKIVFNLLSNAFKYTPNGKMITMFIREDEKMVSIGVQDQGIGIAENKKKSLFVRFENLVDKNLFNQASTGIGLSLVKELVEMHKATISVDSHLGEGSCFKVDFLKGKEHYDKEAEFILEDADAPARMGQVVDIANSSIQSETLVSDDSEKIDDVYGEEFAKEENSKELMLLVEDNQELREFLRSIFSPMYRVVEAADGKEGASKALKYLPDIIISDVMMPEKDGIEMTRELRADMTTSHIPIILLTAKTTIESKLEGLEYGADDYITKPFSATYLQARVENLLMQRKKLQSFYRDSLMHINISTGQEEVPVATDMPSAEEDVSETPPTTLEMSPNDRKFMDKLVELMEQNMDNGELVVDDLVRELAVSRSVFFKKLKTLTGLAPIEFIKEMRIKRATQLIETGEFNMTQISYMVGINDPRYFSKCFKAQVGMTPTEYRDRVGR